MRNPRFKRRALGRRCLLLVAGLLLGPVLAEVALRLECVIGSTADHWLRMQAAYDAAEVRGSAKEITKGLKRAPAPKEPAQTA